MKEFFSQTQRPEILQSRSYPRQYARVVNGLTTTIQPMNYAGNGLTDEGKRQLDRVQTARPAANSGWIG